MMTVTFGICTFLMHFGVYVEDLSNVLRIVLRLMFYATGIFYDVEKRVGKKFGALVGERLTEWNPMAVVISSMRRVLLYEMLPQYKWVLAWFLGGLLVSILGIRLIYKNENSYIKVV
jgi:teichoic acid transport system permease protein